MPYSSRLMMIVSLVNFASIGQSGFEQPRRDDDAGDDGKAPTETWDDLFVSMNDRLRRLSEPGDDQHRVAHRDAGHLDRRDARGRSGRR